MDGLDGFKVEVDALRSVGTRIEGIRGDINAAEQRLKSGDPGDLGSGDLDAAAEDFVDRWGSTLDKMAAGMQGMQNRLTLSADRYSQTDLGNAQYFKGVPEPDLAPKGS
ncbi:WXG100 family type VII secretion target [Micromonospora sp. NPDC047465]|uniref:WXG100 family type VII secretion target n=1 Tax=Micromonospora sp. NPDC047465 TaxID=3154813 RepID=UPI0033D9133E